ncbi:MAG: VOC family protein [Bacteroidia bacterium]
MINKLSHATFYVNNQDEARDFYVEKLGFEIRSDAKMGEGFRWLSVGPKDQPEIEIVLMPIMVSPFLNEEDAEAMRGLLSRGAFGTGIFNTPDVMATYEELSAKGVEFIAPPTQREYGYEALFKDNSGNWFSLVQR